MNKNLDILKEIYKPYRYTIKGNTTILESTSGKFVVKETDKDLKEIYNYLKARNFNNIPKIVDDTRNNMMVYEYIDEVKIPKEEKITDLILVVANLHNKTSYFKEVSSDKYKEIYENIKNNILYLKEYYSNLFDEGFNDVYISPHSYLFMRNYTKINDNLLFCEKELDEWYDLVKMSNKQRIALIHNNLKLDHFLCSNNNYLISWDNAIRDTPILDIVNLYHNEYNNVLFSSALSRYMEKFKLLDDEKKLLFIMISLPWQPQITNCEFENCCLFSNLMEYIYKTEDLIRPYYTK